MPRIDLEDASKATLQGMARSLARTIDAGTTHNSEGVPLRQILDEVIARLPMAPEYEIDHRPRERKHR